MSHDNFAWDFFRNLNELAAIFTQALLKVTEAPFWATRVCFLLFLSNASEEQAGTCVMGSKNETVDIQHISIFICLSLTNPSESSYRYIRVIWAIYMFIWTSKNWICTFYIFESLWNPQRITNHLCLLANYWTQNCQLIRFIGQPGTKCLILFFSRRLSCHRTGKATMDEPEHFFC